ncbi:MAG: transcriptional repressor [Bacteroidota bacterium]
MGSRKKTKPLMILLQTFEGSNGALSSVELVNQLREKMNKTTVYRILQRLEEGGDIHSFMGKDGLKWYAKCKGNKKGQKMDAHPHFQCSYCGKVQCMDLEISVPTIPGYQIDEAELLLIGRCKNCLEELA